MDSGKATNKGQAPVTPPPSKLPIPTWRKQSPSHAPSIQRQQPHTSSTAAASSRVSTSTIIKDKSCFIVYAQPQEGTAEEHTMKAWISNLSSALEAQGWDVYSDQRDKPNVGHNIYDFNKRIQLDHEHAVDMVLVVGTKLLLEKYRSTLTKPPEVKQEIDWVHERIAVEDLLVKRKQLDIRRSIIPILYEAGEVAQLLPEFLCSQTERKLVHLRIKDPNDSLKLYASTITRVYSEDRSIIPTFRSLREWYKDQSKEEVKESRAVVIALAKLKALKAIAAKEVSPEKDETVAQGLSLYIPLDGREPDQADTSKRLSLEEEVQSFLVSPEAQVFLLQGNSGAGKSLFGRYIEQKMWENYSPGKCIPLFISLVALPSSAFTIESGNKGRLMEAILEFKGLSNEEIKSVYTSQEPLFLILDGYDEINSKANLYKQNLLAHWNVKVLITCRAQYLFGGYRAQFTLASIESHNDRKNFLVERVILPFTTDKVDLYIQRFANSKYNSEYKNNGSKDIWTEERYRTVLKSIANWEELAQEPFVLSTLLVALPELEDTVNAQPGATIKRSKVYEAFIKIYFAREFERHGEAYIKLLREINRSKEYVESLFEKRSCNLAFAMLEKGLLVAEQPKKHVIADDESREDKITFEGEWKEHFYDEDEDERTKLQIGLNGSPLKSMGNGRYSFIHKSFQEYFAALKLVKRIIILDSNKTDQEKRQYLLSSEGYVSRFILHEQDQAVLNFLAELLQNHTDRSKLRELLFSIIALSKDHAELSVAAANAVTILNYAMIPFTGRDFAKINIPGADLKGAIIEWCNFSGANLEKVQFTWAWVRNSQFAFAKTEGAIFDDSYTLPDNDIAVSPNGNHTSARKGNEIILYENKTRNMITLDEIRSTYKVVKITFTPDSKCLLVFSTASFLSKVNKAKISLFEIGAMKLQWSHEIPFPEDIGEVYFSYSRQKQILAMNVGGNAAIVYPHDIRAVRESLVATQKTIDKNFKSVVGVEVSSDGNNFAWISIVGIYIYNIDSDIVNCVTDFSESRFHRLQSDIYRQPKLALSIDGHLVFVGYTSGDVEIWDSRKQKLEATLLSINSVVTSLSISPDGQWLAVGQDSNDIRIWNINQQQCVSVLRGAGDFGGWNVKERLFVSKKGNKVTMLPLDKVLVSTKAIHTAPVINLVDFDHAYFLASSYEQQGKKLSYLTRKLSKASGECLGVEIQACNYQDSKNAADKNYIKEKTKKTLQQLSQDAAVMPAWQFSSDIATICSLMQIDNTLITGHTDSSIKCWHYDAKEQMVTLKWRVPSYGWWQENAYLKSENGDDSLGEDGILTHDITKFFSWVQAGDARRVQEVLQNAAMNKRKILLASDGEGQTAMHHAAANGAIDVIKVLATNIARFNVRDRLGRSPLHLAIGHKHVIELLSELGADLNIADNQGQREVVPIIWTVC